MKKLIVALLAALTLSACSSNKVDEESPAYIKESFVYFQQMSEVIDLLGDGKNIDDATEKAGWDKDKTNEWVEAGYDKYPESEEEASDTVSNLDMVSMLLDTVEGEPTDEDLTELKHFQENLEEIYGEYGFKP
jgi:hypothetical protein